LKHKIWYLKKKKKRYSSFVEERKSYRFGITLRVRMIVISLGSSEENANKGFQ